VWRRSGPSGRCIFGSLARRKIDYHTGEIWRPKSRAASTNVATTPARIAEGSAALTECKVLIPSTFRSVLLRYHRPTRRGSVAQMSLCFEYCIELQNSLKLAGETNFRELPFYEFW
jgi:hypothetical protein